MLGSADVITFVPTTSPANARDFYENVVGLRFVSADPFAVVFDANGVALRVVDVSQVDGFVAQPFTILGWHVENADDAVKALSAKGVTFEHYPGMKQSASGIWTAPSGAKIAWFKDPDGNVLSITET
jgi:catechol 2,3-dioxygenase-like lactoylglutathione lyase family enzyme